VKTFAIVSQNCNRTDTLVLQTALEKAGWRNVEIDNRPDTLIFVMCSIGGGRVVKMTRRINAAVASRDEYHEIHKNEPNYARQNICLYGCVPDDLTIDGVDFASNAKKMDAKEFAELLTGKEIENFSVVSDEGVVVSMGCDNFCTYCIIPYARGGVRHRDIDDIVCDFRACAMLLPPPFVNRLERQESNIGR
jgi:threonylcarbamoyladenosine tRNA methylthiotransferase MtaB